MLPQAGGAQSFAALFRRDVDTDLRRVIIRLPYALLFSLPLTAANLYKSLDIAYATLYFPLSGYHVKIKVLVTAEIFPGWPFLPCCG